MFKKMMANKFVKNVSVLASGTAMSQLILVAVLPFLTRIYTPKDFEALALFLAIFSIINVIICLRFEIAIPIAKDDGSAISLVLLSLISTFVIVVLTSVFIFFFREKIDILTNYKISAYLWLLPVALIFWGGYTALQYWATRKKQFSKIAKTRLIQSINGSVSQLVLGVSGFGALGLLLGYIIQIGSGIFSLAIFFFKETKEKILTIKIHTLKDVFLEYKRFPKYSTWEALANSVGIQVPIILIASYAIGAEAGYIMLAMRLLSAPMSLIGGAVAQVYLSEAPIYYQSGKLKEFTYKTITSLIKISIIPMILVAILSPMLIPIIFGIEWGRVGTLITWMVPWFLLQFIASPVSMVLHITDNQKSALVLQIIGALLRVGTIWFIVWNELSFVGEAYAVSSMVFYILYLVVILNIVNKNGLNKSHNL